jgi:hydrogenase maturation protease
MNEKRILILGLGNLLLGDEGVGIHVVRQLQSMPLPPEAEVIDGGTGGFELLAHCRGKRKVIVIDAVKAGAKPGTVLRFTPEEAALRWPQPYSAHQAGLAELLHWAKAFMPSLEIIVYGVVPKETATMSTQVSRAVQRQLRKLAAMIVEEAKKSDSDFLCRGKINAELNE